MFSNSWLSGPLIPILRNGKQSLIDELLRGQNKKPQRRKQRKKLSSNNKHRKLSLKKRRRPLKRLKLRVPLNIRPKRRLLPNNENENFN